MAADITIDAPSISVELPTSLVSDVNAIERRGQALTTFAKSGFMTATVCLVGSSIWWWFDARLDPHFTGVDVPSTLEALKMHAEHAVSQVGFADPFESFTNQALKILTGPLARYMGVFALIVGSLGILFGKNWKSALPMTLGGITMIASGPFISNVLESGSFGPPPEIGFARLLERQDWSTAEGLLQGDETDVGAYVKAQIAYLAKDKETLTKSLDALESMDLSPPEWVQRSRLFAMEEAAYGHPVSEFAKDWQDENAAALSKHYGTTKRQFLAEGAAYIGFAGILAFGLWFKRRAAKIKAIASPFTSVFQPKEIPAEEQREETNSASERVSASQPGEVEELEEEEDPVTDLALSYTLGVPVNFTPAAMVGAELAHHEAATVQKNDDERSADGGNGDDRDIQTDDDHGYDDAGDFGGGGD